MMVSGELDAVMYYLVDPNLIDRSTVDLHNHPDIKPLFADPWAEGVRYYQQDRPLPDQPRHGDQARAGRAASLGADQHPEGVQPCQRPRRSAAHGACRIPPRNRLAPGASEEGACYAASCPTAINANRHVLETIAQYSLEQGLTPRLMKLDELFAASVMAQ